MISQEDAVAVARLQADLPDGQYRFHAGSAPFRLAWFPQVPDLNDQLLADYSVIDPEEEKHVEILRKEWGNEVAAIVRLLEDKLVHDGATKDPGERLWAGLNLRGRALAVWDAYGIPFRVRGDRVYCLWAPRDVMGIPVIKSLPLKSFVILVAEKTATDAATMATQHRQLLRWRVAALVAGVIAVVALLAVVF